MPAVLPVGAARPASCAPTAPAPAVAELPAVVGSGLPVPLVTGGWVPAANLDLAASAPALCAVAEQVAALLPYSASVHRGAGYASQVCTGVVERARGTVARFVGARTDDVVVFTRNTTDALNLLAGAVPGRVVCLDVEHHANLLPWRDATVLPAGPTVESTLAGLEAALSVVPTALLAVTGASNVTGEALPLDRVCAIAHAAGTRVVVDAAQLAPHRRIAAAATGIDYLAFSGHKLYAPFGAGVLVGRRDWLDAAPPHLAGGGASRAVTATTVDWAPSPQRHEAGTPNVAGIAALAAACDALAPVLHDLAPRHERALLARLEAGLAGIDGVESLRIWPDSADGADRDRADRDRADRDRADRVAVVTFTVAGHASGRVAAYLSAEHGIAVRHGKFCAHPLLDRLTDDGAVRASLGIGTSESDVDRLVGALRELVGRGPAWDYAVVDGQWVPTPDPRDLSPL